MTSNMTYNDYYQELNYEKKKNVKIKLTIVIVSCIKYSLKSFLFTLHTQKKNQTRFSFISVDFYFQPSNNC